MKNFKFFCFIFLLLSINSDLAFGESDSESCEDNGAVCIPGEHEACCSKYCMTEPGSEEGQCAIDTSIKANPEVASASSESIADGPLIDQIDKGIDVDSEIEEEKKLENELGKVREFNQSYVHEAIVNGVEDPNAIYKLPFQVSLAVNRPDVPSFCGGVLVNRMTVLTAAHCVVDSDSKTKNNPSDIVVRVGLARASERKTRQNTYGIKRIYVHPYYFSDSKNDIAILILQRPVAYNQKVRRACLDFDNSQPGYLIASGYGRVKQTHLNPGNNQVIGSDGNGDMLKFAYFREKRDIRDCERSYVCLDSYYQNSKDSICQGDSGGPLMKPSKKVIGVASVTIHPSGSTRTCLGPSRYTRFTNHRRFIRAVIGNNYCGN